MSELNLHRKNCPNTTGKTVRIHRKNCPNLYIDKTSKTVNLKTLMGLRPIRTAPGPLEGAEKDPRPCRGRGPLRIADATPIVTFFQLPTGNFLPTRPTRVADAQSLRRWTVAQTFGGLRGAPAGQSYRTGPYRLTRLTPGSGPCAP